MDYNSLVSTVATRLNRTDLTSLIPDFIARAEDEIFAKLAADPVRPMQTSVTQSVPLQTFQAPSNFIDAIKLSATDGTNSWDLVRLGASDPLDYYATRALSYCTEYDSSKIQHYWIIGDTITLSDTPTTPLDITLRYFAKPNRLSSGTLANWVITNHADVYEFGSLMHAARQIRDDEFEDRCQDKFATAIGLMLEAYPEQQNPSELRATDLPTVIRTWNITNG